MHRRVHRDVEPLYSSAINTLGHPFPDLRHDQHGPDAFQDRHRHRRRCQPELQSRLGGVIEASRSGNANLAVADVALRQKNTPVFGIEPKPNCDAVEDRRLFTVFTSEQNRAAAESELPARDGVIRRFEVSQQRDAVGACVHVERRDHHPASGVPFKARIGVVDQHRIIRNIEIDDRSFARNQFASEISW